MTENERLNNALIAAIEERDRLRGERDALAAERDHTGWRKRVVESMDAASLAAGVGCCDQIPAAITKLRAERDNYRFALTECEKANTGLAAYLAAARADAERYRKLRSSAYKIYLFHNGEHYTVELPSPGYFPPSEFDAAIDRALAGKDAP